ncbi:MAG: chemotaxis protein CheX, partial [Spirochaetota bacterium]
MKAEYANVFISGATKVFEQEIGVHLSRNGLTKKSAPVPSLPIAIVIGITGSIRGQVVYSMDSGFAYAVTKAMIPNKLPQELRRLTSSAVSEIANMITGQASIALAGDDRLIHLTPPAVFTGTDIVLNFITIPT